MKKVNANLLKIVAMLSDGKYHDGISIGNALRTTRSAVWKMIKKLQQYQVKIDSIKGKGYALQEPLVLLAKNKLQELIHGPIEIIIFESIDSTNAYLKSLKKNKTITICLSEQQTQGKGRLNREWYSPFGKNIYLSCLYPFQKDISDLAGLSLVTSLAIVKTLNSYSQHKQFSVKWPNDVIYDQQKISGSLIEIQAESHGVSYAIIGIGLNVNMADDDNHISQAWTSLKKVCGDEKNNYFDRNELTARLVNHLLNYLREFSQLGFAAFKDEWMKADGLLNKSIVLNHANKKIHGMVVGINEQGHLLLQLEDGGLQAFSSGDTSVEKNNFVNA